MGIHFMRARAAADRTVQQPTSKRLTRRHAVGAGLAATWVAAAARAGEPAGTVEALRGDAYALSAPARRTLALASDVFVGDSVVTSAQSSLGLHLGAATRIRLGPEAQLRIDRFLMNIGGILVLERGGMLFDHAPTDGDNETAVRSPFGLIAIRGTRFFAGPSNGVFGVFVADGTVRVIGVNISVQVTSGLGTDISRPGAEPTDPARWTQDRIERALASVSVS